MSHSNSTNNLPEAKPIIGFNSNPSERLLVTRFT
jgi:hypothetical protein